MQTVSNLPLGKRARYYQSNMDLDCLEKGADYKALKKCYVIFICTFDYFKKDAPVYFSVRGMWKKACRWTIFRIK